jgi:DNA polymerase-3 subunit delta'
MNHTAVIGQQRVSEQLRLSIESGKIPHARLFSSEAGRGVLPLAIEYAAELICREHPQPDKCRDKCLRLQHPDLHFAFPVAINDKVKSHPVSSMFMDDWRVFVQEHAYGNLFDWYRHIGIENKQGQIGVEEAKDIVKRLRYKPYEGTYQVMIIWMAEKMNTPAANKLLKIIEEPPDNTLFILIAENEEYLIDTIRSRCQITRLDPLNEEEITQALVEREKLPEAEAYKWAKRALGSYGKALELLRHAEDLQRFDRWFVTWVRAAFRAKGNPSVIQDLVAWSTEIAGQGREVQKEFLKYALEVFRQAMLWNYGAGEIITYEPLIDGFDLTKFAPFVHNGNIVGITRELESAVYHIQRNANAKVLFLDLSVKLTRLLHSQIIENPKEQNTAQ